MSETQNPEPPKVDTPKVDPPNGGKLKDDSGVETMFDVYIVDKASLAAKLKKIVNVGSFDSTGKTLKDVRTALKNENALTFRQKGCSFCTKAGAVLNDSLLFTMYLQALSRDSDSTTGDDDTDDAGTGKKKKQITTIAKETAAAPQHYTVYLKSRKLPTEVDDTTKDFLKNKLEFETKKAELLSENAPQHLVKSYDHANFMARVGGSNIIHPADMIESHWGVVVRTNSLLNGSSVKLRDVDFGLKVERAMYPAFRLKSREFEDNEVKVDNTRDIEVPKQELRIPRYVVADDSYVEVSEAKSSVSNAVASSSLTQIDAEWAVGVGAYGYSGGSTGSVRKGSEDRSLKTDDTETNKMTITYNFPRVLVLLDQNSLELHPDCLADLNAVSSKETADGFKQKFGSFFATQVELGGRLHSTDASESVTGSTVSDKISNLKVAAALSFAGPAVQASAGGGYDNSTDNKNTKNTGSLDSKITWEAKGGDTLLCNNPPEWCRTVASFYNWRVVKQEHIVAIEDIISQVQNDDSIRQKFQNFTKNKFETSPGQLNISFFHKETNRYLGLDEFGPSAIWIPMWADIQESLKALDEEGKKRLKQYYKDISDNKDPFDANLRVHDTTGSHVFEIHGNIGTEGEKRRIINTEMYALCNSQIKPPAKIWLGCSTSRPGVYEPAFLIGGPKNGPKENGWQFKVRSAVVPHSEMLEQEIPVYIDVFDEKGTDLGPLCHRKEVGGNILYLATKRGAPAKFTLRYSETSGSKK